MVEAGEVVDGASVADQHVLDLVGADEVVGGEAVTDLLD